jgi:hypothetical protein
MSYQYDLEEYDKGEWKPCLLPCECGYPEPRDLGPIRVFDMAASEKIRAAVWRSGYRLLACPHCELTSFGKLPS